MKRCSSCKKDKPLAKFNTNKARKDGKQNFCRECGKAHAKGYYRDNSERMVRQSKAAKEQRAEKNLRWVLDHLREHPCVDCGETDLLVLEFDHIKGAKKTDVVRLVVQGYSLETIKKEISKCEVRCANCHRRRTYKERGFIRARLLE
jgi:protein-arginine kinase activator protein McsA